MVKKILSVYSSNLILGLLGIITVPILLNNIGTDGYGLFALYLTIASYFTVFELGVLKHLIRLIGQKNNEVDKLISNFYFVTTSMVILCIPLIIFIMYFLLGEDWRKGAFIGIIASIEYIFFLPTKIYSAYARAHNNFERLSLFNSISGLIRYALLIFSSLLTQNVYILIVLMAIRRFFDVKLSRLIIKENIEIFNMGSINNYSIKKVIAIYKESILLSCTQALQINLNGMISLIISKLFGLHGLGIYRSTFDFLSKIWFFSNGLGMVVFSYFSSNSTEINKNKKFIRISWIFYTLIYVVFIFTYPWVNDYILNGILTTKEDILLYVFMLIVVLLIAQGNLSYEYLQAKGNYKFLVKISIITNTSFILFTFIAYYLSPYPFTVILSWMISILIQTIIFERKTLDGNNSIFIMSLILILVWLLIGNLKLM
ncbi:lipopolysaccharide biosynthesis protein [Lysinibacillus xylanilyticus]|uniref:lipopolysaccharide biosynthesis protein n=1 Tax=Lysinibacillus xylanilyticus TaxID=582475 RepID=UPI003812AAD7